MIKECKIKQLELKFYFYHEDHRKWGCWTWGYKALATYTRFCGLIIFYRLFGFSIVWRFKHKGYELYNVEFIPKTCDSHRLPFWGTLKVKNKKELLDKLENHPDSDCYVPFQYYKLED